MELIKECNRTQKVFLILLIALVAIFTVLYPIAVSQKGIEYEDSFLEMRSENGDTIYFGNIDGKRLTFTVTEDKALTCTYGDKTYGPFTAKKDPTAVPWTNGAARDMVGVEIREGEEILFRGGVLVNEDYMVFVDEKIYDGQEPPIYRQYAETILRLLAGPKLISRGNFWAWLGGVIVAALTALSIVFVDELFYWSMSWRVRNAELAEPSDWEEFTRPIGWLLGLICSLGIFISGLIL